MKRLLVILSLMVMTTSAKATLFIANNTDCNIDINLRAHDVNHSTCTLQGIAHTVLAWDATSLGNVTNVNNPPNALWGWQGGAIAVNTSAGWDAVKFTASSGGMFGGQIGNLTGCSTQTTLTFTNACTGITVYATWFTIGVNTYISFDC